VYWLKTVSLCADQILSSIMAKSKKYKCVVVQEGEAWLAQIVRHVTSKKTTISKQRGGFATEQQ